MTENKGRVSREYSTDSSKINRVICVMSYQSSASSLMTSLLDFHPNIISTPDDVLGGFHDFWAEMGHLNRDDLINKFIESYAMLFDARLKNSGNVYSGEILGFTKLGPNRDELLYVDTEKFKNSMEKLIIKKNQVSRKLFFQSLHIAYAEALDRKINNPIIVFGLHNTYAPERLQILLEDFKNIKFIQMVRNPVRVVASRFRWQSRIGKDVLRGFGRAIINASKGGVIDSTTPSSNWRAIRMEDLHLNPTETLNKLCSWLELPWDKSLLKSTVNGKKWWNLKGAIQVSGFSRDIASQSFDEYLPFVDKIRISILFSRKCISWKYRIPSLSGSIIAKLFILPFLLFPFKMEFMSLSFLDKDSRNTKNSLFVKILFILWEVISGFLRVRVALFQVWLTSFKKSNEVELL